MPPPLKLYEPPAPAPPPGADWHNADLLFFWGRGGISSTIEFMTHGPSHVGIVARHPDDATYLLFESTTLCDLPDRLNGRRVEGVQAHEPGERIAVYDGRVARLRLWPRWRLHCEESVKLRSLLGEDHGKPYDTRGAILSGTRLFKWLPLMPYPDLGNEFCSELCAAALMRLGRLPLGNPAVYNPASLLRALRRCGTYQAPEVLRAA